MLQRFLYGFIAIATVVSVVVLDWYLAVGPAAGTALGRVVGRGTIIPLFFVVLVVGGGLELMRLLRAAGMRPHAAIAICMSVVLLLSPWFCAAGLLGDRPRDVEGLQWQFVWLALLVVLTTLAQLRREPSETALADVGATWVAAIYLGLLPSFSVHLRSGPDIPGPDGVWLILIFLAVTKASDVGAFLTGSLIGRHKLLPAVSPGKSVEGAIGGLVAAVLVAGGFQQLYLTFAPGIPGEESDALLAILEITRTFGSLHLWQAIVFGALMSLSGQLGDLFESILKRAAGRKDSASLLPSYGGMLDLIDSPVFAAPVAWFALTVWWDIV